MAAAVTSTWNEFMEYVTKLTSDTLGQLNNDQYLSMLDIAADLTKRGPAGPAGPSGSPPYIGSNNNWFLPDGTDTGISAIGPKGDQGLPGATGSPGLPGAPGQGLVIDGQFNTQADLLAAHPTGVEGIGYLVGVTDPKHLFLWFSGAWHDVGPLTGVGINEAPATVDQPYARNGVSQAWELVQHDGGTWP